MCFILIIIFFAVLERWLTQHCVDCMQFFQYNIEIIYVVSIKCDDVYNNDCMYTDDY